MAPASLYPFILPSLTVKGSFLERLQPQGESRPQFLQVWFGLWAEFIPE